MKEGTKVLYQNKVFIVIHTYESGYCEIKKENGYDVELVNKKELTALE